MEYQFDKKWRKYFGNVLLSQHIQMPGEFTGELGQVARKYKMADSQVPENGWIPASRRPDGTWRKARRVKEGYVPPDEAEKYESKGKQWVKNTSSALPPGLAPEMVEKSEAKMSKNRKKNERKKQQKKEKREQEEDGVRNDGVEEVRLPLAAASWTDNNIDDETIAKKIKNIKKKLRQIEELEAKVASGDIKEPSKEQQEKLKRKKDLKKELKELEDV